MGECKEHIPAVFVVELGNDLLGGGNLVRERHDRGFDLDLDSWGFLDLERNRNDGDGNDGANNNGNSGNSGNSSNSSGNSILVHLAGFMTRAVALVVSTSTSPSSTAKVADGLRTSRRSGGNRNGGSG